MTNVTRGAAGKVNSMCEQMGSFSREMKTRMNNGNAGVDTVASVHLKLPNL